MRDILDGMPADFPDNYHDLLGHQSGVLARWQASAIGLDLNKVKSRVQRGRWQQMHRGVCASFTGEPSREAWIWAAVLRAGADAVLSHHTAAELDRLTDKRSTLIHVSVPGERHIGKIPGVCVHRKTRLEMVRHPSRTPPRTRIEETVIDLTQLAGTFDVAFSWLCQACGSRLTTPDRLRSNIAMRRQLRWRDGLQGALEDISSGLHSKLEIRYVRDVERPHALPGARRQVSQISEARHIYLDNLLEQYGICVELDGAAAHPVTERWRDIHRDNGLAANGIITLRYSWWDVTQRSCQTAAQIVAVLRQRGWAGAPRTCGPGCPVARS